MIQLETMTMIRRADKPKQELLLLLKQIYKQSHQDGPQGRGNSGMVLCPCMTIFFFKHTLNKFPSTC